jgi:predicted DNA-binding protein
MSQNPRPSLVSSTQLRPERDKALDAFVNTGSTQAVSVHEPAPTEEPETRPELPATRKKVRTTHVTFNIPEDLHTKLKRVATMTGINMSQIVSEATDRKIAELIDTYNLHAVKNL